MDPTERALKQITTIQIEEAISKTVSELVGKEYTAEPNPELFNYRNGRDET